MTLGLQSATHPAQPGQTMASPARQARMAGLLYLVMAVLGGFAQIVRVQVYVPGDATATAANVVAKADMLRLSFVADLTQALVWLFFAMAMYRLLQHAGKNLARAVVIFVMVSVAITMLNLVHQMGAVLVATDPAYAAAFGTEGSHAVVLLLMDLHFYGYLISQISWLWLFPLGLLVYRSDMFPRILGVLLMSGTVCYVVSALAQFFALSFAQGLASVLVVPETLIEVSLLAYLLIKGVRTPRAMAPGPVGPATS